MARKIEKDRVKLGYVIRKLTEYQLNELDTDTLKSLMYETMNESVWSDLADAYQDTDTPAYEVLDKFMRDTIDEEFCHGDDRQICDLWKTDNFWSSDETCSQNIEQIRFKCSFGKQKFNIRFDVDNLTFKDMWATPFDENEYEAEKQLLHVHYTKNDDYYEFSLGLVKNANPYSLKLFCKHYTEGGELIKDYGCKFNVTDFQIEGVTEIINMDNQEE